MKQIYKGLNYMKKYFLNLLFLGLVSILCSQNLHAENKEWNIYKNFDYWKYPTIAITRNTSLEGHRVRTEITCSGAYLSAKLIYSYPSDWKNIDIRKKLILEKTPFNFVGGGNSTEQHPKHYSVFSLDTNWSDVIKLEEENNFKFTSPFFETLKTTNPNSSFVIQGRSIKGKDYNTNKENHNFVNWEATVPLKNYLNVLEELKPYCLNITLKQPLDKNSKSIGFQTKDDEITEKYSIRGTFKPLSAGDSLNHISGSASLVIMSDNFPRLEINIEKGFALPPLKGKCLEYFKDESKNDCQIPRSIKLKKQNFDLLEYAPLRIFDIDFDGINEVIIGTLGGNRGYFDYQIYDLDDNNNWIPTISFRSDAKINKDLKTLTDRNDSDVCTSSVTTYQSDGKAFKIIKKVENGYFEEATPNKCITKNSEYLE